MRRANETEVLVVGAGPVGLLTALALANEGVRAIIIDKEERTATHSYACVLHPAALQLLERLGLMNEIRSSGHLIDRAAFYEGPTRRAEINFSELTGHFHYALALPQNVLEQILERRLREMNNRVLWNHRLADLKFEQDHVVAHVDKLTQTAKGYMAADWDWTVQKRLEITAPYVVGADGHDSIVRSRLGIDYELLGSPEQFAVMEFSVEQDPGAEVRIALQDATANVLWPLPGRRCRWSFQLVKTIDAGDFPLKDREIMQIPNEKAAAQMKLTLDRLTQSPAPWFKDAVKNIEWAARVRFEHRLAKQFGSDRTWLVGDAAHQTSPIGGQSMNEGLLEGDALARALKGILHDGESRQLLDDYNHDHRTKWERMLDKYERLRVNTASKLWPRERARKIIGCLPGSREHFAEMVSQLGYDFEPVEASNVPAK